MLMVDDMRTDELEWMPHVQELIAGQGVTFENGFAGFPLCCPARASVLTGQLPHNHGVWSHEPPWGFTSLRDESTVATWLQADGYHTTYLGKYLNGYGDDPEPGKDTGTSTQYVPPGWDLWRGSIDGGLPPSHPDDGGTYRYFDTTLNDDGNGYVALDGQYQTNAYARLTREQIDANAVLGKPWFSYVSFTAPHHGGPVEPDDPDDMKTPARPPALRGTFDDLITEAPGAGWDDPDRSDQPRSMRRRKPIDDDKMAEVREAAQQRAESLYSVDQAVKRIIDRLRRTGQLDNTLVLFTSDNGYFLGERNIPAGKILPYEPSLRVPLVIRGPGIPKGEVRTDPFLSIDYAPTLADLADAVPTSSVDGRSLLDVARLGDDSADGRWSRVVLTETDPTRAARRALAAIDPVGAHQPEMMQGKTTGIRTSRYLYTEWLTEPSVRKPGVTVELYDVQADPDQYVNLAVDGEHDQLLAQLHDVLAEARTCVGAACRDQVLPESLR
jgi:arylsulfatase A-like enzyme